MVNAHSRRTAWWTLVLVLVLVLVPALAILASSAAVAETPSAMVAEAPSVKPFTLIALPDTQIYSLHFPQNFIAQTQWIKEQKDALNIVGVIHEGDITHTNSEQEWKVANEAMSVIDGAVPLFMVMGNHDLGLGGDARDRDARLFNKYFGVERFQDRPWYGGHYPGGNENAFYTFNAEGMDFLVVCLEFGPRDEVLQWANDVVSKHPEHRTIVVAHCYMYNDDTRVGKRDRANPHRYGCGGNDGEEIWEKFVRKHKNIFLVLSGHIGGAGRLTSAGDHGNAVHQLLADYQEQKGGGNGWLRVMVFMPGEDKIVVKTYSPVLEKDAIDEKNQFELPYVMD